MVTVLPVKQGISAPKVTSIPKNWSAEWFRRFITNYLENADIRNANAGSGISITGTISEPATVASTLADIENEPYLLAIAPSDTVLNDYRILASGNTAITFNDGGDKGNFTLELSLYPIIMAEQTAGVVPNTNYPVGNVLRYGIVGNGSTDDTSAMQKAATIGIDLYVPSLLNIRLTGGVAFNAGQTIQGTGTGLAKITPIGSFDVFTWGNGTTGGGCSDLLINAAGMTGGNCFNVTNASGTNFRRLILLSPFDGFFIKAANITTIKDVWISAATGAYCIQYIGDNSNFSSTLDIDNVEVSGAGTPSISSPVGLLIDGNVQTVDIRHFLATNTSRGILTQNTAGGTAPQFLTAYDVQIITPYEEGVKLTASMKSALFTDMYIHGSVSQNNFYVDSTCQHVSWQGGKTDGALARGGYLDGKYITIANVQCSGNSQSGSAGWPGWEIGVDSIGVKILGGLAGAWSGVTENQSYGISVTAGATTYLVKNVNMLGNVTGQYIDHAGDGNSLIEPTPTGGNLTLLAQTTGTVNLGNQTNGTAFQAIAADATTVNNLLATGHATGTSPALSSVGSDTNLDLVVNPKGTGNVKFGTAGSFSANGSVATALTSVGPIGSHTTVQTWLTIKDNSGTVRYIPCF